MTWITAFQLGNSGNLKTFSFNPSQISFTEPSQETEQFNLAGDLKITSNDKCGLEIRMNYGYIPETELAILRSIANDKSAFKKLVVASTGFQIQDEIRALATTTTVKLRRSSRAGITVQGVWTNADTGHSGTNYYSSFVEATKTVTLGSSPGAAGTLVRINYLHTGWDVKMNDPEIVSDYAIADMEYFNTVLTFRGV